MELNSVNMFMFNNYCTAAALWFGKVILVRCPGTEYASKSVPR